MIRKIKAWCETTTFDGKIVKKIGTVFGDSITGKSSVDVQRFKRFKDNDINHIRLGFQYIGFGGYRNHIILDRQEAMSLVRFLEDAISDSSEVTNK